jgi:hypothetical protein
MITALDISMAASGRAVTLTLSYGAIGTAPPVTTPSAAP